jgi:hypothetical protein
MTDRTSSVAAAEELLKRRSTRKSLAEWARHKGFEPAKHHLLIINEIESFLEGEDEVLLLFAPPGSAKSRIEPSLASRLESDTHLNQRVIIETGDAEKRALLSLKLLSSQRERSKPVAREEIPRSRPLGAM